MSHVHSFCLRKEHCKFQFVICNINLACNRFKFIFWPHFILFSPAKFYTLIKLFERLPKILLQRGNSLLMQQYRLLTILVVTWLHRYAPRLHYCARFQPFPTVTDSIFHNLIFEIWIYIYFQQSCYPGMVPVFYSCCCAISKPYNKGTSRVQCNSQSATVFYQ